ncbi:MAG TPA: tetratricopeptide repeat protein, partial [Geothrix sp.]|nr:tetratricopeptide repeat protein [Geothrix sp.]
MGKLTDDMRPRLMMALVETGQRAEAQREAREILKRNPAQAEALMLLADTARTPEEVAAVRQEFERLPNRETAGYHAAMVPLLLRSNRVAEAEAAGGRALALDPKLVTAHLSSAALRQANQDLPGMESALRTASELAPARSPERLRLAEVKKRQGALEEARTLVTAVLKEAPDYIPALMLSAELSKDAQDYKEAGAMLEKIFAIDSANPGARLLQADLLLAKNDAPAAVDVLQRLDRMFSESPNVRLRLARAHLQAGQPNEAEDLLNGLLVKQPDFIEASLLLAAVHLRQGNPAAVVPAMQAVLEKSPDLEPAALNLVLALEAQRRFEEAATAMRRLTEQKPGNAAYGLQLGQLLVKAGQGEEARKVYEKMLESAPDDPATVSRLVDVDVLEGKMDDAVRRASALREGHPTSAFAVFTEARVRVLKEEWEAAESSLKRVLELDPNHAEALDFLARLYVKTSRLPEAGSAMEQRLQQAPNDLASLRLLAVIRTEQKEYAKAAEAYERIMEVLPQPSPEVMNNLAVLYADHLGKPDRALELAKKAQKLRPSVVGATTEEGKLEAASIADTLGWVLYRKGRFPEAFALAQEAVIHLGSHPEVQAHFGLIAAAMGRSEEATTALSKAVGAEADFPSKAEARQRLALLTGGTATPETSADLAALVQTSPSDPLLYTRLAAALEKEHKYGEAAAAYGTALKLNPELATAALRLAELHAGPLKDPMKAIGFAKTARELAPNDAPTAAVLGGLAYRNGEYQWSYDLLTEAARGGRQDSRTLMDLGRAAYSLGRVAEARAAVQQALQATPEAEAAAEAKVFLDLTATPAPAEAVAQEVLTKDVRSVPALMVVGEARLKAGDPAAAVAAWQKVLGIYPGFAPARKNLALALLNDSAARAQAYDLALKAREALPDDPDLTEALAILTHHRRDHQYAVD